MLLAMHGLWWLPADSVTVLQVSLDKARTKSEAIVGQEDVPMRSKLKEVEKIYARARAAAGQGGKVMLCGGHVAPVAPVNAQVHNRSGSACRTADRATWCSLRWQPAFPV
jgi:hypothetical protein